MPIYTLGPEIVFPPPNAADESGILAIGGDLTPERLFEAYRSGIFPWFDDDDPIIWWSPDPRFVLRPEEVYISKSMRQILNRNQFKVTYDRAFEQIIRGCRKPRKEQSGTWITHDMFDAYLELHNLGLAHSIEVWQDDHIVGGLYGISIGNAFFGESMFSLVSNASKVGLIHLTQRLQKMGFTLIDCQVYTKHLESMGARNIPRNEFLSLLKDATEKDTLLGNWGELEQSPSESVIEQPQDGDQT